MREYLNIASQIYGYADSYQVRKCDHVAIIQLARDLRLNDEITKSWWIDLSF